MFGSAGIALALVALVHPATVPVVAPPLPPSSLEVVAPPQIGAASWLLFDDTNGAMLASFNTSEPRALASVTKLLTALVVLDHSALTDPVIISDTSTSAGEAEVGLVAGETWTVWELLSAIVVRSANDAAVALAEHVGGSVEGFAELMNEKAASLGMVNSRFVNPHGLDAVGHFSTADDLLILAKAALADPVLSRLMRTRVVRFRPDPLGHERRSVNTNALLGAFPGVVGVKTGFTSQAGRILLGAAERDDRRLITVVMGAEDHFADTRILLEYGFHTLRPGDLFRLGLVEEQGGGAGSPANVPEWLRVRLALIGPLRVAPAPERSPTPLERSLVERFQRLLPGFVGRAA